MTVFFFKLAKVTFYPIYSSSRSWLLIPNTTKNLSLPLLWFVSAQQAPLPVLDNYSQTRPGISLCTLPILSTRQGPLPGQLAHWRHRTVTYDPGLVNPEFFLEASQSAGALDSWQLRLMRYEKKKEKNHNRLNPLNN